MVSSSTEEDPETFNGSEKAKAKASSVQSGSGKRYEVAAANQKRIGKSVGHAYLYC